MPEVDHFERLGLPRRFDLDLAELERQYLTRSRAVHPDFHQFGGEAEQRASLELSSALNEAYATLRDPFRRAEYLLQLEGGPSAAELKEMPATFLEEMLASRMEIEELKESGSESPELVAMERQLVERREGLLTRAGHAFTRLPEASGRGAVLKEVRELLNATKYVQGLLRDLRS
jgi:molecular chaperone HscB